MLIRMTLAVAVAFPMLGAPGQAQRAKVAMGPSSIGNPGDWITSDDYPADAIAADRQGRVVTKLGIDASGKVISCAVVMSSGTESLDTKTCEIALARGTYNPATDRKGRPIASTVTLPVRWVIPSSDGTPITSTVDVAKGDAEVDFEFTSAPDGKVITCRVLEQPVIGGAAGPDPCKKLQPGTDSGQLFTKDGKPVGAVVRLTMRRSVTPVTP